MCLGRGSRSQPWHWGDFRDGKMQCGIEAGVTEDGFWESVTRLSVYEKSIPAC